MVLAENFTRIGTISLGSLLSLKYILRNQNKYIFRKENVQLKYILQF